VTIMDDRTPPGDATDKPVSLRPNPTSVRPPPMSGPPAALPDIDTGEIAMPDDDDRATNPRGIDPVRVPETQVLVARPVQSALPVDLDDARPVQSPSQSPAASPSGAESATGSMRIVRRRIRMIGGGPEAPAAAESTVTEPVLAAPVSAPPVAMAPISVAPVAADSAVAEFDPFAAGMSVPPEVSWRSEPAPPELGTESFDTTEHEAATVVPPAGELPPGAASSDEAQALSSQAIPHDLASLVARAELARTSDTPPELESSGEVDLGGFEDEPTREMRAVAPPPPAADPEEGIVTARVKAISVPSVRPASFPPPPRVPSRPPPSGSPAAQTTPVVSVPMPLPPVPPRVPVSSAPVAHAPVHSLASMAVVAPSVVEAPAPRAEGRDDDHVEISLEDFSTDGPSDPSLALLDLLADLPPPPKDPEIMRAAPLPRGSSLPPPPPDAARASKASPVPASMRATAVTTRGRRRLWWEELFNDDYFRTVAHPSPAQVLREADWIDHALGVEQGASVLDVGCGMGRQAVELARRGYSVLGLDYSPSMLSRAADLARDLPVKPEFVQGDMAAMEFEGRFDAAYCVGTSFGYFDDERNLDVVRRIHRALKPHGTFLLEVLNRDHAIQSQPAMSWYEGEGCLCMEETAFNYITSRLNVKRTMIFDDGRQRELEYGVRLFSLHELGQVLHQTGFRVVEVSGHPRTPRAFFGPSSRQLIILAQKRAQEEVLPGSES